MAVDLVGNVQANDEYMHEVEKEGQFNESMLFTWFSPTEKSGGWARIGNRPNEGHAEMTLCLFLPDGRVAFQFRRADISSNDAFDAGGMRFEVKDPGREVITIYEGLAALFDDPLVLVDPSSAFKNNPRGQVEMNLTQEGIGPLYGGTPFPGASGGGHYEQHMHVRGHVLIDGHRFPVDALGNRDHSWGVRDWHAGGAPMRDRTLWCTFGPDLGIAASITWVEGRPATGSGYVSRDGVMTRIVGGNVDSEFQPDTVFHTAFTADIELEDGDVVSLSGVVESLVPLRHRRGEHVTHIGWAMTEFTCNGVTGRGMSEYMDVLS